MISVKVFLGGQTVTLGKVTSTIGLTSIEVETGLSFQPLKDLLIRKVATPKPVMTTMIQKSRENLLEDEM